EAHPPNDGFAGWPFFSSARRKTVQALLGTGISDAEVTAYLAAADNRAFVDALAAATHVAAEVRGAALREHIADVERRADIAGGFAWFAAHGDAAMMSAALALGAPL